jgi:hypothetical protein
MSVELVQTGGENVLLVAPINNFHVLQGQLLLSSCKNRNDVVATYRPLELNDAAFAVEITKTFLCRCTSLGQSLKNNSVSISKMIFLKKGTPTSSSVKSESRAASWRVRESRKCGFK